MNHNSLKGVFLVLLSYEAKLKSNATDKNRRQNYDEFFRLLEIILVLSKIIQLSTIQVKPYFRNQIQMCLISEYQSKILPLRFITNPYKKSTCLFVQFLRTAVL